MPHLLSGPGNLPKAMLLTLLALLVLGGCRNPWYLIVQPARLWVSVPAQRRIYELDREGLRTTLGSVGLEAAPGRLAWSSATRQVVAVLPEARAVTLIDPDTFRIVRTAGIQGTGQDVAVSSSGLTAFVLLPDDKAVALVNLRDGTVRRMNLPGSARPVVLASPKVSREEAWVVSEDGRIDVVSDGSLQASTTPLSQLQRPLRALADAQGGIVLLDGPSSTLIRLSAPRGDSATRQGIGGVSGGGAPADCALAPDGSAGITFPDAGRMVRLEPDGKNLAYATGANGCRAIVADARGFHVAHEAGNQVFSLTWSGSTLLAARLVDTLPGPPVAMIALD